MGNETPNPGGWGGRIDTHDYSRLDQVNTADGAPLAYDLPTTSPGSGFMTNAASDLVN